MNSGKEPEDVADTNLKSSTGTSLRAFAMYSPPNRGRERAAGDSRADRSAVHQTAKRGVVVVSEPHDGCHLGTKPQNHASRNSLVVPVLPAEGRSIRDMRPVPPLTTPSIAGTILAMTSSSRTFSPKLGFLW